MRLSILLFFIIPIISNAQQKISGHVRSNESGIPGATVQVKGINQSLGTVSDVNGYFEISDLPTNGDFILEIRSMGFKTTRKQLKMNAPNQNLLFVLEESTLSMDEVVVTGTMNPTFISQSPIKVDVINANYLSTYTPTAATGIIEGISLVNGVQEVVACGVCFTNSISINGLPGPYTAILMDGAPIYGNLASVYGLNGIPSMIIDRFEVIKGPSSTLYGSEAVAGVINIITKDPATQPTASIDIMGTTHKENFGNLSFSAKAGKSNGFLGVNYAYINDFEDFNEDGFGDNINLDRISLFSKWNINRPSGKGFTVSGKYYYEDRRNGVEEYLESKAYRKLRGDEEVYGESIYTKRLEFFGSYELPLINNVRLDYSLSSHDQNSYYGSDFYKANQNIYFANVIWNPSTTGKHNLTVGHSSRYQSYDDNTVATETRVSNEPENQYIPGVFLQDEWNITDRFTNLIGLRADHYENHGFIFAPRLSSKYKVGEWSTFRTNFGTGFRIVNLFTEDHAFVTGQREVVIEEELQPEESYNISLNFNHLFTLNSSQGMIDIDVYYTYFTNKITPLYDTENQIIYSNTGGFAVSKGIGFNIQQEFAFPFSFNIGFNIQDVTETEEGDKRKIEYAPSWTGVVTSNYELKSTNWVIAYSANFTGPMTLPEVYDVDNNGNPSTTPRPIKSNPFALHNIQVTKELNERFSFYFGSQNLFNYRQEWSPLIGFNDPNSNPGFGDQFDTAYAYSPIIGREFYLGLILTFI